MSNQLPPYITREAVLERLPAIFPEGTPNRNYCIRLMSASTIFTMLYIGAVDGNDVYAAPKHIYRMTVEQAQDDTSAGRTNYRANSLKKGVDIPGVRWYADNTREPIRDETLREGLQRVGAVIAIPIPTTSSKPRYALQQDFAALFNPNLTGDGLARAIEQWQHNNLSAGALIRISLAGRTSGSTTGNVLVSLPNGEVRSLSTGLSSDISKAVIEIFAPIYLVNPAVLWISTSDAKVPYLDKRIANSIGLNIEADKELPDIILADLAGNTPTLIFVEVVATDGAVTPRRQEAIYNITEAAGLERKSIAFVTAYLDRQSPGFKKTIANLAWGSFAWFVSEPDKIVHFSDGSSKLIDIISPINL
ncbi:BsuBI/PstI family type II restriction endonuclease [Flavobacterium sp. UBA4197]|uniref:BsuBI/PstI family type II restriction endonuclease n=1 Tax=Flavobacterium sp. UBA4197 TaxID=1946546 RepID=UPI00257BBD01|nr:BsuBI/PstI family type II restriction endonuclease [Flavobacterium sp. UBA4197]